MLLGSEGLSKVAASLLELVAFAFVFSSSTRAVSSLGHVGSGIRLPCLGGILPGKRPRNHSVGKYKPLYACTHLQRCSDGTPPGIKPGSHSVDKCKSSLELERFEITPARTHLAIPRHMPSPGVHEVTSYWPLLAGHLCAYIGFL